MGIVTVLFLVYDGSFPMDPAIRILEKYMLKADVGLYLERKAPLDEAGEPAAATLTLDQVRHSFSLSRIVLVSEKDIQEAGNAPDGRAFGLKAAQLVSQILATGHRDCELVYLLSPRPDNYYLAGLMTRLLNVFSIDVTSSIGFSIETETGLLSEGLLSLLPVPAFEDLITDTDTVSLLIFFDLLGRIVPYGKNATEYPLTISKVSTIIQPALRPLRGKHRGFQGTYQRLSEKAEELRRQGILQRTSKDDFTFYSLTRFGRVVAQVLQDKEVLRYAGELVRELFLDSEGSLNVEAIRYRIAEAKRLGWIKP